MGQTGKLGNMKKTLFIIAILISSIGYGQSSLSLSGNTDTIVTTVVKPNGKWMLQSKSFIFFKYDSVGNTIDVHNQVYQYGDSFSLRKVIYDLLTYTNNPNRNRVTFLDSVLTGKVK